MKNFIEKALKKTEKLAPNEKVAILKRILKNVSKDNDLMAHVLDSLSSGVLIADAEDKVIFISKYTKNLIGLRAGDFSGKKAWEMILNSEISKFVKEGLESCKKSSSKIFNCDYSDNKFCIEVRISDLSNDTIKAGHIINIENVTDREIERANKKRAESFASLTALTAGVAHEIKNPLGSISIYLQLMEKQLASVERKDFDLEGFVEKMKAKIDILNSEVNRLNDIVVDFLYTVRPMDEAREHEQLNAVIKESVLFLMPVLEKNNIEIELRLEENLPLLMLCKKYIKQVIINLIINAKDALKDHKEGKIIVTTEKDSDSVTMSVYDNGSGISSENLAKIFDPYFTTKDSGSGIGLTLVYKIIKGHDGDISVNSRVGSGTLFKIRFPRIEKEIKQIEWEKI